MVNLQILAERPGKVTVSNSQFASEVFSSTRNVSKGITTIQIPSTLVHNPSYSYMYQNKGLRIISSVDVSVIVTMNLGISNMFDSMLLLPTVVLSTEYVVLYSGEKSTLIAGIESNTHFQIRCQTVNGPSGVLGQYQTYLLHNGTASDTFSCSIFSTKPIAVFLSGFGHSIWTGLEQAIPVSNWGKQYVIPEIHTDHSFQILASQNDTFINIDTSPPLHIIAQSGQLRQSFVYKSSLFLDSNQPIMTLEYKTGFQGFLTTIPAVNQFGSRYVFYVPDVKGDGYEHYVTVIFETDGFGGFVFDEVYIPAWIDKSSTGKYTVATFQVFDPGYHVITVTKEEAFGNDMLLDVFGGIVYGYNPHSSQFTLDAYAHPLGMVLSTGKPGKNLFLI